VIVRVCHAGRVDQYAVYMGLVMLKFFPCVYICIRFPGKHCLASAADFDFLKLIVRVCHAGRIDQHDIYMVFDVGPAKNEGANQNLVVSSGLLSMQAC